MRAFLLITFLLYPLMPGTANAEGVGELTGLWRGVRHGALVNIVDCGNATPCGALASVSEAVSEDNTNDVRNRNLALRERPLIGVPILWGFQRNEVGWQSGGLYNPEDGKTFRSQFAAAFKG